MTTGSRPEDRAIVVSYADIRNVGAADVAALVTDADRRRLATITRPRRRSQYLASRALLRFALERCTGRPATSHRFILGANGKPQCVDGPMISVTHSGALVACAISSANDVGIDVQLPTPRVHTADIARQFFSPAESHWLRSAPDDAFYMLWVLKEAYLKSLGRGLADGLGLLDCRIMPPSIKATAAVHAELALYSIGDAFLGIASVGHGLSQIAVECWSPSPAAAASPLRLMATTV
jgi:4'-phosphopantetheinyl transferase